MWLTGPVAPWYVGSSQTRARTRVPCIGRQILNHCATREAPKPKYLGVGGERDQAGEGTHVAVRGPEMPHTRTSLDYFFHSVTSMIPVHSLLGILNQGREEGDHGAERRSLK